MTTQYFVRFFFIHLKPRVESFWGVLSCCLTPSILFNFRYKKIKTYMANLFTYFSWRGPTAVVHRNESVLKSIFKRGYEEIRDIKLLGILKKDRTWLKYELHCNVKTPAPLFFQNNLTFVIQMLINVFPRIVFDRTFFFCTQVVKYILFLFNYICIDLFIKIINFINDDCKLNLCYINYDTYMSWSVPMVFDEFNDW